MNVFTIYRFLTASYVEKASLCVTFSKKKSKLCLGANLIKQILSWEDKITFKFLLTSVLLLFWSYTILYMFIPIITPHLYDIEHKFSLLEGHRFHKIDL